MTRNARLLLEEGWKHSVLSVGLDPKIGKIPACVKDKHQGKPNGVALAVHDFCIGIVLATCHLRPLAYKPNFGFFTRLGPEGLRVLMELVFFIKTHSPTSLIIDDCKDGDIGDSMDNYVDTALSLDVVGADAMTASPYLGPDTFQQLLAHEDKLAIFLCKTSNKKSGFLQNRMLRLTGPEQEMLAGHPSGLWANVESIPVYQFIAMSAQREWNANNNCALVVGATYPNELEQIRALAPEMPLLLPGFGKQGAPVKESIQAGRRKSDGRGIIAHVGSDIMYASSGEDCFQAAKENAEMWDRQLFNFANA